MNEQLSGEVRRELRAELDSLRKRLQDLEGRHAARRTFSVGSASSSVLAAVFVVLAAGLLYGQSAVDALFINQQGNVGIGTTSPGRKLTLSVGDDDGVSVQSGANEVARLMRDGAASNGRVALWAAGEPRVDIRSLGTSFFNGGNIGIGTTAPSARVDIQDANRSGSHPNSVKGLYVTGEFLADQGVEFRHSNGTQGIGFGYNTIYATGGNAAQDLNLKPRGGGAVNVGGPVTVGGAVNVQGLLKASNGWVPALSQPNVKMRYGQQVLTFLPAGLQSLNVTHGETFQSTNTYMVLANVSELHPTLGDDIYTTFESHPISNTQFIVRWSRSGGRVRQVVVNYLVIGY